MTIPTLRHELHVNDLRIAITQAAKAKGLVIEKWFDDAYIRGERTRDYVTITKEKGGKEKVAVIPDAYFLLQAQGKRGHFFVEVDLSSESTETWRKKVRVYETFVSSGGYEKSYGTRALRILCVTKSRERMENLLTATEAVTKELKTNSKYYWFTSLDQITPEIILLSPIWRPANEGSQTLKPLFY